MGMILGITAIIAALFVGISIIVIANHNIRTYNASEYVLYSTSKQQVEANHDAVLNGLPESSLQKI